MAETATLTIDGVVHELPIVTGTMGERAIDISACASLPSRRRSHWTCEPRPGGTP